MDLDITLPMEDYMHDDVDASVDFLFTESQKPTKERTDVSTHVEKVANVAQLYGLSDAAIDTLIKATLGSSHLDNTSSNTIIANLFPIDKVSSAVVYSLVSRLGPGSNRAPLTTQGNALRWLVLVSDVLQEPKAISRVYGVLFNLLDLTPLRDYLCQLLFTFTEPYHVRSYRASALKELRTTPFSNANIVALLSCYHAIRPELVTEDDCAGKAATFECPDIAWRNRLEGLQHGPVLASHKGAESQFRVAQRTIARRRQDRRHLVQTETQQGQEGLENVVGIKDFVAKLPQIVRPTDMESVLDDPLLQHYMATGPDDIGELDNEVDEIMAAMFEREMVAIDQGRALSPKALRTLRKVLRYARFQKFLPGSIERFITSALKHESCSLHLDLMLELLSWKYPDSHAWKDSILSKETERHIIRLSGGSPEKLLEYYALVLRNRTSMFLSGTSAFEGSPPDPPTAFTGHCSSLALAALARSQSVRSKNAVLSYLSMLAKVSSQATPENSIPIFNIEGPVVYLLLFGGPTVDCLSSLLSLLADYKKVFEEIVGNSTGRSVPSKYPADFIKRLNGFLMDCCNLFWRSRAFSAKSDDKYAAGCLIQNPTQDVLTQYLQTAHPEYSLSTSFSLACHPALAGLAAAAWDEIEADRLGISESDLIAKRRRFQNTQPSDKDTGGAAEDGDSIQAVHFGPVSRLSLSRLEAVGGTTVSWSHYRLAVLDWLDLHGGDGVGKLMKKTMKLLMDKPGSGQLTPMASPAVPMTVDTPMTG